MCGSWLAVWRYEFSSPTEESSNKEVQGWRLRRKLENEGLNVAWPIPPKIMEVFPENSWPSQSISASIRISPVTGALYDSVDLLEMDQAQDSSFIASFV